jgi:NAD(P)-dependent dehydrogenase (short-subunit alcohol dehydrogenase family)
MTDRAHPLAGRRAVITGASRGIGRAMAIAFAECGADVLLVSRNPETLAEVSGAVSATGRSAHVLPCDVTADDAPGAIAQMVTDDLGGLDILVNNAGGNSFMVDLANMRFSGWRKTMDLNLDSAVRITQALLPALVASGNGSIVNVSSVAGMRSAPFMSQYAAAKAAMISLTASLAGELATSGVRVNALVPGWIETDLTDFLRLDDGIEANALRDVPMGRWGRVEEIAEGAVFLASDASSFMTGQTLVIDGGLTSRP